MAEIKRTILGDVSGKIGDIVFRKMNGKKFVSVRPKKYKPTKSTKLKNARSNFATVVNFAKVTNSVPELKTVWEQFKSKASNSYHKIITANSGLVKTGVLTAFNKITPDGLELNLISAFVKSNKLEVTISFPSVKTGLPAALCMVFCFGKDKIFAQTEMIVDTAKDNVYSFAIPLNTEIKKALKTKNNFLLYLAVAGTPAKRKIFWTDTTVEEFT